ncbi:hypothetical protein L204_104113 [Cryptococcus depauperatus]|nr:hypothetical protein L204_03266 [Cryptococcus depauperatus CBS 7855]
MGFQRLKRQLKSGKAYCISADDIVEQILKQCDQSVLCIAARVSKSWNQLSIPLLYKAVTIDCDWWATLPKPLNNDRQEESSAGIRRTVESEWLYIPEHTRRPASANFRYTRHLTLHCHNELCGIYVFGRPEQVLPRLETLHLVHKPPPDKDYLIEDVARCPLHLHNNTTQLIPGSPFLRNLHPKTVILTNMPRFSLADGVAMRPWWFSRKPYPSCILPSVKRLIYVCESKNWLCESDRVFFQSLPSFEELVIVLKRPSRTDRWIPAAEEHFLQVLAAYFRNWKAGPKLTIVGAEGLPRSKNFRLPFNIQVAEWLEYCCCKRMKRNARDCTRFVKLKDWLRTSDEWIEVYTKDERKGFLRERFFLTRYCKSISGAFKKSSADGKKLLKG